ncbi:lysostaphin resistance A-like protein [Spirillospora sp. CA-294931]|uniref:CPBP family intramembrane glutamic endopeptidase n=1 Tax=Spirillospora sp. CA-294931 TaxID=3240042 RepID=UPI003D918D4E
MPTPEGRPYHQMARSRAHRWWRPVAGTLVLMVGGLSAVIVVFLVGMIVNAIVTGELPEEQAGDRFFPNSTADLAFNLVSLAVFLPITMLVAVWLQRRRPGTLSSVAGRLRWRWMLVCSGLAVLFCAVGFGTSLLAGMFVEDTSSGDEHWVGWGTFLTAALVIVALVPFQAAAEEYVFRGWLLQAIGACTLENRTGRWGRAFSVVFRTPWPAIVVPSALFMAGHGYTGWGMLDIFAFGALAGWLAVRSGGLEASIAVHVFNNLMAFLLPAAVGELDIEQGDVPWQVVLADLAPMALYGLAVVWLVRRMKIQTVTSGEKPSPGEEPPAVERVEQPWGSGQSA